MERRAYRITGTVQGVGFRWWTRKTATDMDLRGTVRNAGDGSVEVQVEGPEGVLEDFEDRLRQGPSSARVRDLTRQEPQKEPLPTGFDIVR
jgi:acylphosphatase